MLYKSLILGILFGIGLFAVKSGIGLSYLLSRQPRLGSKALVLLVYAIGYGLVFGLAALLLHHIDPLRHLAAIQTFLRSGMIVHMIMAGSMAVWGVLLLKRPHIHGASSRGWMLLVLPCPVCTAVILFSSAFLVSLFPDSRWGAIWGLYLAFLLMGLSTMGIAHLMRSRAALPSESFLGGAMLLMAVYFMLSVTVMPQFADLDSIYRLARYQTEKAPRNVSGGFLLAIAAAAAFGAGWRFTSRKIRSST
jgi:predicted transporter